MNQVRCIDETFDLNSSLSYHLTIQVSLNGFSYCILNSVNNKFIFFVHYPVNPVANRDVFYENIEKILHDEALFSKQYKSVSVIWDSDAYTVMPNELFDVNKARLFFEYNYILNELDELHNINLKSFNANLLFSIPSQITNPFIQKFTKCIFYHRALPFIETSINCSKKNLNAKYFFIQFQNNNFDILVIYSANLILYNQYQYRSDVDVLYYLQNISNQLNWNSEDINIICSGEISKSDSILKTIRSYFKSLKVQTIDKDYLFSYTFNKVNILNYFNLFSLSSCV